MSERGGGQNFPDLTAYQGGEGPIDPLLEDRLDLYEQVQTQRDLVNLSKTERDAEKYAAEHDMLTGLENRRKFEEHLRGMAEVPGADRPLVVMIDLDKFKAVNDQFGHAGGDKVLQAFARIIQGSVRGEPRLTGPVGEEVAVPADVVARFGGEEFALILYGVRDEEVDQFMNLLRARVEQAPIDVGLDKPVNITASFGVSRQMDPEDPVDTIRRADIAAYKSKESGRNRVTVYTTPENFHTFNGV